MDRSIWWRRLHSLSTWCHEEVSASHLPHDTPLFMKGALYLKLGALSSWSLVRAVTALHKHHPGSLWTLGFDGLWWAVTWLIRLIYFKVGFHKRSSPPVLGWSLRNLCYAAGSMSQSGGNIKYTRLVMLLYVSQHFQNSSCTAADRFGEKVLLWYYHRKKCIFFTLCKVTMWLYAACASPP